MLRIAIVLAAAGAVVVSLAVSGAAARERAQAPMPTRFTCYAAQFSAFKPRRVTIVDAVARRLTMTVDVPDTVCAPAAGDGRVPGPQNYLTCYRVRVATAPVRVLRTVDEFGRLSMRASRPLTLCVPSARVDRMASATPERASELFTCYAAKPSSLVSRDGVDIVDEFGDSEDDVSGPSRVCAPAVKDGRTLSVTRPFLNCYGVESDTKATAVVVRSEWGFLQAALGPRGRLCVSATAS